MDDAGAVNDNGAGGDDVRRRIVTAAAGLIAAGGPGAATTRAVSAAASVQAPTIYRLFGDKRGLLDAVAEHGLRAYVADKARRTDHDDPVQALRDGWDLHVAFGVAHPGLFAIMAAGRDRPVSPAWEMGLSILRERVRAIALAGRLRVSEARAVRLLQAAGTGVVMTLIGDPDPRLSVVAREAVLDAITGEAVGAVGPAAAAATLRASLHGTAVLSDGERLLLAELLDRIADDGGSRHDVGSDR